MGTNENILTAQSEEEIIESVVAPPSLPQTPEGKRIINIILALLAAIVLGILVWQGITAAGNPDPTVDHINKFSAILDTGILVFREGLEAILVLAALTASLVRSRQAYWKPVTIGASLSF